MPGDVGGFVVDVDEGGGGCACDVVLDGAMEVAGGGGGGA